MTFGTDQFSIPGLNQGFAASAGAGTQALNQQMQQFMLALQFQQQQAALQQALNFGTQYGFAPGGNWMTWGQGGPTQPAAGTPSLAELASQMGLSQAGLQNALNIAGVTGQFAAPAPSQYAAGTVLTAPSTTPGLGPAYGVVNADGSVTMATNQELSQLAAQRGTSAQAMMNAAQPVDWNTLQTLSQGPPRGPTQETLAGLQQQYQQALGAGTLTGTFYDPSQTPDALLQQGKAMNGQSFNDLPPDQQQFWLQWNANNPTQAAQQWARGVNNALQQAGYVNPQAGPQQTLQSQLQNAQLTGMYQGAPTQSYQAQGQQEAQAWASILGYTPQLNANGQPILPTGLGGQGGGVQTEQAREFNLTNALQQGQLGQQYLSTAAQLTGPQNTFQLSNYLRGAQGNPNVPVYLQNLQNNMGLPAFQATGNTAPTPQSAAGLTAQMGYGVNGSGTPRYDANGNPITSQQGPAGFQGNQYGMLGYQYGAQAGAAGAYGPYAGPAGAPLSMATMQQNQPGAEAGAAGAYGPYAGVAGAPADLATMQQQQYGAQSGAGGQYSPVSPGGSQPRGYGSQVSSATPGWNYGQTLNSINQIAQRGAQGLGPGSLERLTPDELAAFGSGLGAAGYSLPSFLNQYAQSRVGQQAPVGQMSLAG